MAKQIHFRIFEYEEHQMLARKDYDEDEDAFQITFEVINERGTSLKFSHGYNKKSDRDHAFAELLTEETAQAQYNALKQFITM